MVSATAALYPDRNRFSFGLRHFMYRSKEKALIEFTMDFMSASAHASPGTTETRAMKHRTIARKSKDRRNCCIISPYIPW